MNEKMTSGSPMKHILQFAFPILLGNLFQQTYNMADAAIVSRILGMDALAALGSTSSVQFMILGFCMGICTGFSIPVAHAYGAGNESDLKKTVFNGSLLAGATALVITAVTLLLCRPILDVLHVPGDIYRQAYVYLAVILAGIPLTVLYNWLAGILRSIGDSRTPFVFLVTSSLLNIVLDLFCIVSLGWGVFGAAFATVFAQGISGLLCLVLIRRKVPLLHLAKEDRIISSEHLRQLARMGYPMGIQFSIEAVGSMVQQSTTNALGTVYVSAIAAGTKIKQLMLCPFDALASAGSTFLSQNYGAGDTERVKKGLHVGIVVTFAYAVVASFVLYFAGRNLSTLFVAESAQAKAVLDASALYLSRLAFFWWANGISKQFCNAETAIGFSSRTAVCGFVEMTVRILVSLLFVPKFGYDAITWIDQSAWIVSILYIMPVFMMTFASVRKKRSQNETYKG